MRWTLTRGLLCLLILTPCTCWPATHDLMPAPAHLEWREGTFLLGPHFGITSAGTEDPRVTGAIVRALARLRARTGLALDLKPGYPRLVAVAADSGRAVQALDEDESYTLNVDPRGAELHAPNPLGILHGLETFLSLVKKDGGRFVVPAVRIEDRPRFPWRGLLLDPCRHFEGMDVVKRTLDAMAAVKLNVFHWHLSDDQGFRIESRVFPLLQGRGSDGLFYTQDQVRTILAYARERGIRVVPEFDMPGHSTSWLVGYPELGIGPPPGSPERAWGIFDRVLDPSRKEVYDFLDRFIGEMAALFPDAYFHIGGDEVTPRTWNGSAHVLGFMYEQHLADADELQAYFNARLNEILARHGKRMVGWDEILATALPKNIVVQSWTGGQALAKAARLGYDAILSNDYYLDLVLPASLHYLNDPIPEGLEEGARGHVLGGEACMWGEFVDPETIDSRLWPRGAAIAERLWSPQDVRDVDDMYRRLEIESGRLEEVGALHRKNYLPMLAGITGGRPTASLKVLADLVEPVKRYRRGDLGAYTRATPLDRLVDAARPESMAARAFRASLKAFIEGAPGASLRATLVEWRDNHASLDPILVASPRGAEVRSLSRSLSAIGGLGLDAMDAFESGTPSPVSSETEETLAAAEKAGAEVELAVARDVRKLVVAGQRVRDLRAVVPAERSSVLDSYVAPLPKDP